MAKPIKKSEGVNLTTTLDEWVQENRELNPVTIDEERRNDIITALMVSFRKRLGDESICLSKEQLINAREDLQELSKKQYDKEVFAKKEGFRPISSNEPLRNLITHWLALARLKCENCLNMECEQRDNE